MFLLLSGVSIANYSNISKEFFINYIARWFLYLIVIILVSAFPINIKIINPEKFIKYIVFLEVSFFAIETFSRYVYDLELPQFFVTRQDKMRLEGNFEVYRYAGTASEPAYLVPLISIPLYYYLFEKKNMPMLAGVIVLFILTFSTFGYGILALTLGAYFLRDIDIKALLKKSALGLITILMLILVAGDILLPIIYSFIEKIKIYVGVSDTQNWSALQRKGNTILAVGLLISNNVQEWIVGRGTGFFAKYAESLDIPMLIVANEAHSYYLATLIERGLVGILVLGLVFKNILSRKAIIKTYLRTKSPYSALYFAIRYGIIVRMIHWIITGTLWRYYFWVEVIILISIESYAYSKRNRSIVTATSSVGK